MLDSSGSRAIRGPDDRGRRTVLWRGPVRTWPGSDDAGEPSEVARRLLAGLSDRWDHTREVAARARSVAAAVPDEDRRLLVDAAWLHDIGYSPEVSRTGFHPLDGARHLLSIGASADLVGAVAHQFLRTI